MHMCMCMCDAYAVCMRCIEGAHAMHICTYVGPSFHLISDDVGSEDAESDGPAGHGQVGSVLRAGVRSGSIPARDGERVEGVSERDAYARGHTRVGHEAAVVPLQGSL